MIQQTSLEAYIWVKQHISRRQEQILKAFKGELWGMTNKRISKKTGLPINCVTPRVQELRKKGILEYARTTTENGRKAMCWELSNNRTQTMHSNIGS